MRVLSPHPLVLVRQRALVGGTRERLGGIQRLPHVEERDLVEQSCRLDSLRQLVVRLGHEPGAQSAKPVVLRHPSAMDERHADRERGVGAGDDGSRLILHDCPSDPQRRGDVAELQ